MVAAVKMKSVAKKSHCLCNRCFDKPQIKIYKYWDRLTGANSIDPDQVPGNVASDQGLYCFFAQPAVSRHFSSKMDLLVLKCIKE